MANQKLYTVTLSLPDGTRKYFRGKTKKEAEKKKDQAKVQLGLGVDISCKMTFAELADTWFTLYKKGRLHRRSEETITNTLDRYILPILGQMKVSDVKAIHIQQLMTSVKDYSKSTQKKVLQYTRAVFEIAVENGMIVRTPVSKSIKASGTAPSEKVPLTKSQIDSLISAVEGTRAYPLILVLLYGGLRIGEALGLMWSDIDFEEGTISVNRSIIYPEDNRQGEINNDLKTKNARRTIPLPWHVFDVLRIQKEKSNSLWVFSKKNGEYHSYGSICSLWGLVERRYVSGAIDFKVHPHLLRHTCITRWFEQGLDIKEIQYLAGHSSVDVTLGIYTHYSEKERRKKTAEKIRAVS